MEQTSRTFVLLTIDRAETVRRWGRRGRATIHVDTTFHLATLLRAGYAIRFENHRQKKEQ
jgi:hypothetical protein